VVYPLFCLYFPLFDRIAGFFLPGISLLIIAVRYGGIGGGDIKLMVALGFCFGIYGLAVILFSAVIPAYIYAKLIKGKSVPLATFLCVGFFVYVGLSIYIY
jgi:leader peptidase (prepilin peptidase)/N-methyltransferase